MRQSSTTLFSMTSSALAVIAAPIRASNRTAGAAETLQVDRKEGPQKTELGRQYPVGIEFWKRQRERQTETEKDEDALLWEMGVVKGKLERKGRGRGDGWE
ncbi:unnamed protein product [Sphagnum tenellum]